MVLPYSWGLNHSLFDMIAKSFPVLFNQQQFYVGFISLRNQTRIGQISLLFFGFLCQDVTLESMLSFDLS